MKVECSLCIRNVMGSNTGQVLPRAFKMVHTASLTSTRHFWGRAWEHIPVQMQFLQEFCFLDFLFKCVTKEA